MLDALAYPVSVIMKIWHTLFGFVVPADSGIAWVGTVIMLVVTIRLLLARSMWKQMYSMRKMAQLSPKIRKVQKEHKDDRALAAQKAQEVYKEAGVNPAAGCLPLLVQIPVFFGLYWVLINFSPADKTIAEAEQMSNGAFGPADVTSFLHAELWGVPLAAYIPMPQEMMEALKAGLTRPDVMLVALPLFIAAGIATYINMRNSMARQEAAKKLEKELRAAEEAQAEDSDSEKKKKADSGEEKAADATPDAADIAEQMQESMGQVMKVMLYLFPLFPLLGGLFYHFPIAIAIYWFVNNIWTMVQNHIYMDKLDKLLPNTGAAGGPPLMI